jgi:hypothetical protein
MTGLDLVWMAAGREEMRFGSRLEDKDDDRELTLD